MIQNDCMTTYVDLICDISLCTHNSASLGLFPSAPARVHSNIDIDIDIRRREEVDCLRRPVHRELSLLVLCERNSSHLAHMGACWLH